MTLIAKTIFSFLTALAVVFVSHALAAGYTDFRLQILNAIECFDGADNDGDGNVDYPNDADCESPNDNSEAGGGGGGGSGAARRTATLEIAGLAYPQSPVLVLKDGQLLSTKTADASANFSLSLGDLLPAKYLFSIYAKDTVGRTSALYNLSIDLKAESQAPINKIILSPTLGLDKLQAMIGETIKVAGQSAPSAELEFAIKGGSEALFKKNTDSGGNYGYDLNTTDLKLGQYTLRTYAKTPLGNSPYSKLTNFTIGPRSVLTPTGVVVRGDLNGDNRVNLVDFSIAAFHFKKPIDFNTRMRESINLNNDGVIDLVDFSIMAYYWTG